VKYTEVAIAFLIVCVAIGARSTRASSPLVAAGIAAAMVAAQLTLLLMQ
jgi:hypothetical protein